MKEDYEEWRNSCNATLVLLAKFSSEDLVRRIRFTAKAHNAAARKARRTARDGNIQISVYIHYRAIRGRCVY